MGVVVRESPKVRAAQVYGEYLVVAAQIRLISDLSAIRRPGRELIVIVVGRNPTTSTSVCVHDVDIDVEAAIAAQRVEGDKVPARGPRRI
jgi:hypothetical protein